MHTTRTTETAAARYRTRETDRSPAFRRVILVVLDGLRPDAIDRFELPHLTALSNRSAWTRTGRTVDPSITVAAMASLLTGTSPTYHGIQSERFRLPRRRTMPIHPLPDLLAEADFPFSAFLSTLPPIHRIMARRVIKSLGPVDVHFSGHTAREILANARDVIATQRHGLIFMHWPDADDAGHAHGWMSTPYAAGAHALDTGVGELMNLLALDRDPSTLVILTADHGGGGESPRSHESDHPIDHTIPLFLVGDGVRPGAIEEPVSLLDVPATVLWALDVPVPESYLGRPLSDAFRDTSIVSSREAA